MSEPSAVVSLAGLTRRARYKKKVLLLLRMCALFAIDRNVITVDALLDPAWHVFY